MQFRLRTLWAVMTLAAVVAAAFGGNVVFGIWAYVACFSLFMVTWRMNAAGRKYDACPPPHPDPGAPARILWGNVGMGVIAAIVFLGGCSYTQLSQCPIVLAPSNGVFDARSDFNRALWVSIPVGTAAALGCYWLSWPGKEKLKP